MLLPARKDIAAQLRKLDKFSEWISSKDGDSHEKAAALDTLEAARSELATRDKGERFALPPQ